MMLTKTITRVCKHSLTLTYSPIYQEYIGVTNYTPTCRFFDSIIDVDYYYHVWDSPIHWSNFGQNVKETEVNTKSVMCRDLGWLATVIDSISLESVVNLGVGGTHITHTRTR